ncbi:H-NS family nucleoid-associated regulatory protein [Paraburkholderia sp. GAS42]|uniref:H-NS family nucleoid-associated regulatory protein n=1 Tax=Paraburkholderia sp. GAS42 TaxID=3035135 RepID=UPI003D225B60
MRESTYLELRAKLAILDEQIERARAAERSAAIERIRELMDEYNISPHEVVTRRRGRPPVPPRYRNPATGQTWTGWGKRPAWLGGKNSREFLVARST